MEAESARFEVLGQLAKNETVYVDIISFVVHHDSPSGESGQAMACLGAVCEIRTLILLKVRLSLALSFWLQ